uniref:Uncharacterized protein n=1 Tax=Haptolina brevifila TaxID=156173 RepID=A0A7S2CIX3_9EUKA
MTTAVPVPLVTLPSTAQQSPRAGSTRTSKPKGGLSRMRHNAQLSERGKNRTQAITAAEAAAEEAAAVAAAAQRKEEALEAFTNRTRAVTFLPASMDAMIELPADGKEMEETWTHKRAAPVVTRLDDEDEVETTAQPLDQYQEKLLASLLVR